MFAAATVFTGDISEWDVSAVNNMRSMFDGATAFNVDISEWNVSKATVLSSMFNGATAFAQTLCWDLPSAAETDSMFYGSPGGLVGINDPKCGK
jgi:surface protein